MRPSEPARVVLGHEPAPQGLEALDRSVELIGRSASAPNLCREGGEALGLLGQEPVEHLACFRGGQLAEPLRGAGRDHEASAASRTKLSTAAGSSPSIVANPPP